MKPFQTIQLNVKVTDQTAEEIKKLDTSRHQTVAELLRHFIEEGLKIYSYEQNIDFIAGIIRQEFTSVNHIEDIRTAVNQTFEEHILKINKTLLKSGKVSATGYFLLIKVLMEMGGLGPDKIARLLKADKILTPTVYEFRTNGVRHTNLNENRPYEWCGCTVADILEREEYIGNTINCRSCNPYFKSKKSKRNPPEKQLRFEHTHEPLIDMETWEIVQKVRAGKRRPNKMGEMDMLSGMVYCADCGKRHYFCRCGRWNESPYTYTCGTYHGHKEDCTPHTVKVMALHEIVLAVVQRVTQEAREHTEEFLQRAMDKLSSQLRKELSANKTKELYRAQKRLTDLEKLFLTAFEQLALANLSETQFKALTSGYEEEKQELTIRSEMLEQEINTEKDRMLNADRFLKVVQRYTDIQELTPEVVREFIEKIVVHERSEPWKKKNYTQQIDVYFNFVGQV